MSRISDIRPGRAVHRLVQDQQLGSATAGGDPRRWRIPMEYFAHFVVGRAAQAHTFKRRPDAAGGLGFAAAVSS